MHPLTTQDIRAHRLIAQLLAPSTARPALTDGSAGSAESTVHAVAAHMLATQAQNLPAGVTALGIRAGVPGLTEPDLAGTGVVRSWSQRGTHHLLAAEDVRWMTLLCSPRVQKASAKRRGSLGLSDADVDTCRDALLDALATAGAPLSRSTAYAVFAEAGVDPDGNRGSHMLRHFGGEGKIIQGPRGTDSTEASFVLHDTVVADPRELDGEDALQALAIRYYRSHGPATVRDLAWWSGLTVRDCKAATQAAVASGSIVETTSDASDTSAANRTMYLADWQEDVTASEIADALDLELDLPAFDEYLLGYSDRADVMSPDVGAEVGPTKNGLFRPFHVRAGEVTGRL